MRMHFQNRLLACVLLAASSGGFAAQAGATAEKVLYSFTGESDGDQPMSGLIESGGTLYGTTLGGGDFGYGTVFKVSTAGHETVLHSFQAGTDGNEPTFLISDRSGNLYGTTGYGGDACQCGTVFKISASGQETIVYAFKGGDDGQAPGGLAIGKDGNLYGTTAIGGAYSAGTIFKIDTDGTESVLYSFGGVQNDGTYPVAPIMDAKGNLYGATTYGGSNNKGTVFKFSTRMKTEKTLYSFSNSDGTYPSQLMRDRSGNLYGTLGLGGAHTGGSVFKVTKGGVGSIVYAFTGGDDGCAPEAPLLSDKAGNLYGTAWECGHFVGTVFKIDSAGGFSTLYEFQQGSDAAGPMGSLVRSHGKLYGTSSHGGSNNNGAVFELKP